MFFGYPPDIRKGIYTTNAIESLNSALLAAIKKRKVFPTNDAVRKVVYLAIKDTSKKWSMPIQNWRLAMSRFIIEFGDRMSDHLQRTGSYTELLTDSSSTNNFQNLHFSGRNTNGVLVIRQDILCAVTVLFNSNIVITA